MRLAQQGYGNDVTEYWCKCDEPHKPRFLSTTGAKCPCNEVLQQDREELKKHTHTSLALLYTVDQEHFEQFKKDVTQGGDVSYGGVKISSSMQWKEFQEARDRQSKRLDVKYDADNSINVVTAHLSDSVLAAWTTCMEQHCLDTAKDGVLFWIGKEKTKDSVDAYVKWFGIAHQNKDLIVNVTDAENKHAK